MEPQRESISFVTQSKYFSPVFNTAIFDGPIRIYFAQYQESLALQLYFGLQERLAQYRQTGRWAAQHKQNTIFLFLYPSEQIFADIFAGPAKAAGMAMERFGQDFVLGISAPPMDEVIDQIYARVEQILTMHFALSAPAVIEASPSPMPEISI